MTDRSTMRNHVLRFAAVAVALSAVTMPPSAVIAQIAAKVQAPPRSLIQKLRAFLGVNPPVAVGGSRSGGGQSICLLSPWPSADREGEAVTVNVGVSRPVLLAAGQLNEIRLEKDNRLLWQERASSIKPIEGPIPWPIQPLQPGEQLTLKLRPRGASGGDFATFLLRAVGTQELEANERQAQQLGNDPMGWNRYLEQLRSDQMATAAALLSSPQAPAHLRQSLQCSER